MRGWWKQKRDAKAGREEAERTLEEVKSRDPEIAELGHKHRVLNAVNGFGESAERAIAMRKRRHA
jgi:hypothetical protein